MDKLIKKVPFKKLLVIRIKDILRGNPFYSNRKKLMNLQKFDGEISGLFTFYENNGGVSTPRSKYAQAQKYWRTTNKNNSR